MGQIKNIKLHIVTDIKPLPIIQHLVTLEGFNSEAFKIHHEQNHQIPMYKTDNSF